LGEKQEIPPAPRVSAIVVHWYLLSCVPKIRLGDIRGEIH
jgi:hypothetical protein